ncbi:MAG: hypothetical protein DME65_12920 [Verrucomicrobia bacterium]|nr:MAG: hypothetical protein DME65_12920 [Verrucomicrobiota bacterium]
MRTIRVHVVPNAKIAKIVREPGEAIKIKVKAPAKEGKANAALPSFLSEKLNLPQRAIILARGERSRDKVVRIDGLGEEEVRRRSLARV